MFNTAKDIGVKHHHCLQLNGCRNLQPHSPPSPRLWRASFARSVTLRLFLQAKKLRRAKYYCCNLSMFYCHSMPIALLRVKLRRASFARSVTLRLFLQAKKIYAWHSLRPAIRSFSEGWWRGGLILRNSSLKLKTGTGNVIWQDISVSSENISESIKIKTENGFHLKVNVCKFRSNESSPEK